MENVYSLTDNIIVEEASEKDIEFLVEFNLKMALETEAIQLDKNILNEGVKAVFTNSNKGKYFTAKINNKICGSLLITYEWSDWRNSNIWWIQSVFVEEEFRKKGVYKNLYEFVKIAAKIEGVKVIRLYVDLRNKPAQAVYSRLGMNDQHYKLFEVEI